MDFFAVIWDLLFWCIGIFCVCVAYGVGMLVSTVVHKLVEGIGEELGLTSLAPLWPLLDLILRLVVIITAVVVFFLGDIPFDTVLSTFFGFGDFDELTLQFLANQGDMYFLNNILSVAFRELFMTFIYFLPYFVVMEAIGLIKKLFCGSKSDGIYAFISFVPEMLTLLATNVLMLYMGNGIAYVLLEFLTSIQLKYGLFRMLWRMALFCVYINRVVCDMFTSDLFLSMIGANIAALILNVTLGGELRMTILIISIVLGFVSKLMRALIGWALGIEHDLIHTVYGLISMAVLSGAFVLIFKVMGV